MIDKNRYVKEWEDESLLYYEWEKNKRIEEQEWKKRRRKSLK